MPGAECLPRSEALAPNWRRFRPATAERGGRLECAGSGARPGQESSIWFPFREGLSQIKSVAELPTVATFHLRR